MVNPSFSSSLRGLSLGLAFLTATTIARAEEEAAAPATPPVAEATNAPAEAPAAPVLTPEQEKAREIMAQANQAYYTQNFSVALTHLDEVEKLVPNDTQVSMMRAGCYAELGEFAKAQAIFEEMLKKTPDHFAVRFNLIELLGMQKKYGEAREGFIALLKDFPNSDFVRFKIVLTYLAEKNQQGAIEWFQKMRERGESPELSYAAAALATSQGKFVLAERLLIEAEQRHPGALRHLHESLAAIDFATRSAYPPRVNVGPASEEATVSAEAVLEGEAKPAEEGSEAQ